MSLMDITFKKSVTPYTVSQITARIRDCLEETFYEIWVEGEVSDLRVPSSGHTYFMLKDEQAQLRCVLFKGNQRFLKFRPEDGMKVLVRCYALCWKLPDHYEMNPGDKPPEGHLR